MQKRKRSGRLYLYSLHVGVTISLRVSFKRGFTTFFFHASSEAFVESAETTLVPLIFIHDALSAEPSEHAKLSEQENCDISFDNKVCNPETKSKLSLFLANYLKGA